MGKSVEKAYYVNEHQANGCIKHFLESAVNDELQKIIGGG